MESLNDPPVDLSPCLPASAEDRVLSMLPAVSSVAPAPILFTSLKHQLPSCPQLVPLAAVPHILPTQLQLQQQFYSYAIQQLRHQQGAAALGSLLPAHWAMTPYPYKLLDPRLAALYRPPDEPKPQHSYIGLIAMAILSHEDNKLVLSDIYQYILDNYAYFRNRGTGWRNSIRHNLSLNDCFIKAGRSPNGKGHFWAIHPANIDDFRKGDFRRRKAQRRVRRHMGLTVEEEDSLSPPPTQCSAAAGWTSLSPPPTQCSAVTGWTPLPANAHIPGRRSPIKRRQFDMASLLAPDEPTVVTEAAGHYCQTGSDPNQSPGRGSQQLAGGGGWPFKLQLQDRCRQENTQTTDGTAGRCPAQQRASAERWSPGAAVVTGVVNGVVTGIVDAPILP